MARKIFWISGAVIWLWIGFEFWRSYELGVPLRTMQMILAVIAAINLCIINLRSAFEK